MDAPSNIDTAAVRADLDFWRDLAGGDDACGRELLTLYLVDTAAQISLMVSALAAGRSDDVGRAAHTCAGSSSTCGIDILADLFRRVEQQACDNQLDKLSDTVPLIVETFEQVHVRLMKAIVASLEPTQERT
jgi:HPt (histidine-containing phosphotransfer) domain-containing protein